MKKSFFILWMSVLLIPLTLQSLSAQKKSKKDYVITISTILGDMNLILYEETPKHRANFLKLVDEGFYNELLFHRVIDGFMIQGGDPDSKNAKPGQQLGRGGLGYEIEPEFNTKFFHKKGVLAAARNPSNPKKESSSCQFYIVQGRKVTDQQLEAIQQRYELTFTDEQKKIYKELGGAPHLDQEYTIYGEVIKGLDVIDKISLVKKDRYNRPTSDVKMTITAKKMSKKKITKLYGYQYL